MSVGERKIGAAEPKRIQIEITASDATQPIQSKKTPEGIDGSGMGAKGGKGSQTCGPLHSPLASNAKRDGAAVISGPYYPHSTIKLN